MSADMSTAQSEFEFSKVKIKQERLTPPPKKEENKNVTANEIIPKLFSSSRSNSVDKGDKEEKKSVEPAKSSNEILAELFKVFNAAPPKSLLNDEFLLKKKKKHKNKDRKHKKKAKKRDKDFSEGEISDESGKSHKKHKKKKRKKSKKRDYHSSDSEKQQDKKSNESDFVISDEDEYMRSVPAPIVDTSIVKREKPDNSPKRTNKIVIKDLKNSSVLKEAEKVRKKMENAKKGTKKADESSEISLSDEETYLREKEAHYRSRDFYGKSRYRGRSGRRRYNGSSSDRFRDSWRDSRSRSRHRRRERSRSRSRRSDELVIDKKRLLEIARKNAITMFKSGSLPGTQGMTQEVKDKVLMKMRYGGKTVEELTEFCKKLSKGESLNDLSSLSSNDDSDHDKDGNEKIFHHPFVLKDRGPIVMNIKNATPIPPKTAEQTKAILMQYPVSSGQLHRQSENEWIPVSPKKPDPPPPPPALPPPKPQPSKNVFEKPLPAIQQQPAFIPMPPVVEPLLPPPVQVPASNNSIFVPPVQNMDVSSIISQRLNAMRKLQENPTDPEALKMMYNSQREMSAWASSKFTPGQFLGSTGASILSAKELTAGQQAWAKRVCLTFYNCKRIKRNVTPKVVPLSDTLVT